MNAQTAVPLTSEVESDWRLLWVLAYAAERAPEELKERLKLKTLVPLGYAKAEAMRAERLEKLSIKSPSEP